MSIRKGQGAGEGPKSLEENVCFSLKGEIKIINIKKLQIRKKKKKEKEVFKHIKGILKLILSNIDF